LEDWHKGVSLTSQEKWGVACIVTMLAALVIFVSVMANKKQNEPTPPREELRQIEGEVYKAVVRRNRKIQSLDIEISVRTPTGGSWTGALKTCGVREERLLAVLGARVDMIRQLPGRPVVLLTHQGRIHEIVEDGQTLISDSETRSCFDSKRRY
jgi:hypothetical protein